VVHRNAPHPALRLGRCAILGAGSGVCARHGGREAAAAVAFGSCAVDIKVPVKDAGYCSFPEHPLRVTLRQKPHRRIREYPSPVPEKAG
jgi:hypothetical protein